MLELNLLPVHCLTQRTQEETSGRGRGGQKLRSVVGSPESRVGQILTVCLCRAWRCSGGLSDISEPNARLPSWSS